MRFELEMGHRVIHVKQGCTVELDSYYYLKGGAVEYQDQELALKVPNVTLKGIFESKKKSQEDSTVVVDDLDFESIERSIQNLKIPNVTKDSGVIYQFMNDGGLPPAYAQILVPAFFVALLIIIILLGVVCELLWKAREQSSNDRS